MTLESKTEINNSFRVHVCYVQYIKQKKLHPFLQPFRDFQVILKFYKTRITHHVYRLTFQIYKLETGRQIGLIQEAKRALRFMFLSGFWIGCYIKVVRSLNDVGM